jgi:hypothetical protein
MKTSRPVRLATISVLIGPKSRCLGSVQMYDFNAHIVVMGVRRQSMKNQMTRFIKRYPCFFCWAEEFRHERVQLRKSGEGDTPKDPP